MVAPFRRTICTKAGSTGCTGMSNWKGDADRTAQVHLCDASAQPFWKHKATIMVRIARSLALGPATLPLAARATLMPSEQPDIVTGSVPVRERLAPPPPPPDEIR